MQNTRTFIRSSMVSLIIVLMGFFMLCMSRAPRISFDEPLVEGGGLNFDSYDDNDQDFLSLLNDMNEPSDSRSNSGLSDFGDDSDILALLSDDDTSSGFSGRSSQSGDEGLDEILRLLESGDDSSDSDYSDFGSSYSSQQYASDKFSESGQSRSSETGAMDDLEKEVERLEGVLNNKTREMESLQAEVQNYDQKISQFESQIMSGASKTPVKLASSKTVTVADESPGYSETSRSERTSTSRDRSFEDSYNAALELFYRRDYDRAIDQFQKLVDSNPRNSLANNCQYWIGESRFAQGKYYQAIAEFIKVFAFEGTGKQDDAQLMLGMTFMKLGEIKRAQTEFDWLVCCYSSSEHSKRAGSYLSQF